MIKCSLPKIEPVSERVVVADPVHVVVVDVQPLQGGRDEREVEPLQRVGGHVQPPNHNKLIFMSLNTCVVKWLNRKMSNVKNVWIEKWPIRQMDGWTNFRIEKYPD